MKRIAPIRLQYDPRTLWFDPEDFEIAKGDGVIVSTARGEEYGEAASPLMEVEDEEVSSLKTPLKPIVRLATDEDRAQMAEMRRLSDEALPIFKKLASETNENMHPVMVEYLFGGSKAIFLFEAEERADFRELVRRLTAELHIRVDMRQIGVRDEARLIGGLGHCGQELCCRRLGGEFCPVSIRMAKAQDLSLNPQQISGVCGRLMCCLRYEYDTYKDFKSRAPKDRATIHTPAGDFKVCELDTPHEEVVLKTDEGKRVRIPLSAFDQPEEGAESKRPKSIGDVYYDYANKDEMNTAFASTLGTTENFTTEDKLADEGVVHHNPSRKRREGEQSDQGKKPSNGRRRRKRSGSGEGAVATGGEGKKPSSSKKKASTSGETKGDNTHLKQRRRRKPEENGARKQGNDAASKRAANPAVSGATGTMGTSGSANGNGTGHRKARRRSHKTGGSEE